MRKKNRKKRLLTLFAFAACFTFAFGGCDTGNEFTSSSGESSSVTESLENGSESSVAESAESSSASSVEVPLKKVYYESQIRFYVNPENPTGDTSNSQYGVYGTYGTHVLDNMIKLLQSDAFAEKVLLQGEWTAADDTEVLLNQIRASVAYSYENKTDNPQLANSFIDVSILVEGEENYNFACELYDSICVAVPEFVEANMAVPSGYTGTNCQKILRNDKPVKIEK